MPAPELRPVTFLTDFGYEDEYPGVCRLVIAGVDQRISVIDISHGVPPGDIRRGALALASAVPFSPPAVHLAVVDPGVGTDRRALVLTAGEHHLVGPDNGLLELAAASLGGVDAAFDVSGTSAMIGDSDTFHGRDVFSPVAAELARGVAPGRLGTEIGSGDLVPLKMPEAAIGPQKVDATVLFLDRYGNAVLDVHSQTLGSSFLEQGIAVWVETTEMRTPATIGRTFADVTAGEPVILIDSSGHLALAVNRGSAGARFGLSSDDRLEITPVASSE